jgi:hypothetical protein
MSALADLHFLHHRNKGLPSALKIEETVVDKCLEIFQIERALVKATKETLGRKMVHI